MKFTKHRMILGGVAVLLLVGAATAYLVYDHNEKKMRFVEVEAGRLYRSRQPLEAQLRNNTGPLDIRRIVNLRPENEKGNPEVFAMEVRVCREMGVEMVNLPIEKILPTMDQVAAFLRTARHPGGATLVHCEHGRNRTSIMVASYRIVMQSWDVTRAMDDMVGYTNLTGDRLNEPREFLQRVFEQREELLKKTTFRAIND